MTFFNRTRRLTRLFAVLIAVGLPASIVAASIADARVGGRSSVGSRGTRTFSAPPSTSTAPSAAQPMQRTTTQPGAPASTVGNTAANTGGGFFNRPGLLGGLAMGFLGAGLFGMLAGSGFFSGLGSLAGFLGFLLQAVLVFFIARLAINWWRRRNATAFAGGVPGGMDAYNSSQREQAANAPSQGSGQGSGLGGLFGGGARSATTPIQVVKEDYDAFERLLGQVQHAWTQEDMVTLRRLATPEMAGYFAEDLAANQGRGVVNQVSDVKLLQGDLAEAWREGEADYATVALRFALIDKTIDRTSGRIVDGSDTPDEATELWTFRRERGSDWTLSAIQQTS
jgi:predicted lipid-binding transport protein (Tim44 family)